MVTGEFWNNARRPRPSELAPDMLVADISQQAAVVLQYAHARPDGLVGCNVEVEADEGGATFRWCGTNFAARDYIPPRELYLHRGPTGSLAVVQRSINLTDASPNPYVRTANLYVLLPGSVVKGVVEEGVVSDTGQFKTVNILYDYDVGTLTVARAYNVRSGLLAIGRAIAAEQTSLPPYRQKRRTMLGSLALWRRPPRAV